MLDVRDGRDFYGYTVYADGTIITPKGKTLKQRLRDGRLDCGIIIGGKKRTMYVHRIVANLFVEQFDMSDKNICVTVLDGNFANVNPSNLVVTHRADLIQGSKHKAIVKLTDEQVEEIRSSYKGIPSCNQFNKATPSYNDLAKKYGTTKGNIAFIVRGNSRNSDKYILSK